jgi:hypothetical protein
MLTLYMQMHKFLYVSALSLLICEVPATVAFGGAASLQNSGSLAASAKEDRGTFMSQVRDHAKPEKDAESSDELPQADPAEHMEKQAGKEMEKAVPDHTPPPQEIRDEETEAAVASVAEVTGVKPNEHGTWQTLLTALVINTTVVTICVLIFSGLRLKFPLIYSGNVHMENPIAPIRPEETFFGWISATCAVTTQMAASSAGLDSAMLLEYFNMCIKILAIIGVPMVSIMCPMHRLLGGNGLKADSISGVAMGNVEIRHPFMYYLHAIIVNLVTVAVIRVIYQSMETFLDLRYAWLKALAAPRCVTVLVEGIPEQYRSDARLAEFMKAMFKDESVKEAVVVKKCPELKSVHDQLEDHKQNLANYRDYLEGDPEGERPMMRERMCLGEKIDAIKYYEEKVAELEPKVEEARLAAVEKSKEVGGVNTSSGFVTFARRRQATHCLHTVFTPKRSEWIVSSPPPASDVLYDDFKQNEHTQKLFTVIAYGCIVALYLFFMPVVVTASTLSESVNVGIYFQPLWDSFVPGMALIICLGFVPTIILLIFRSFFTLKADSFAQHKLQIWYFFFLVFYVVLVTAIGQSLRKTLVKVVRNPESALELMAESMPDATHFYMDFFMLQWVAEAINFMRHVPLAKFLLWRAMGHDSEKAKELAEPEDQDYYGIGSRSARFTINMLVAIIFSTLSPLMCLFALVLMAVCRLFYGYLIVFAETKKPDLGGVFFYTQLQHLMVGVGIYNVLMIGVLGPSPVGRAKTMFPSLISSCALVYTIHCYQHFKNTFVWSDLPFTEIVFHRKDMMGEDNGLRYIQPELLDKKLEDELAELKRAEMKRKSFCHSDAAHRADANSPGGYGVDEKKLLPEPHFLGSKGEHLRCLSPRGHTPRQPQTKPQK